jgi:hypothetical protein
MICPSSCVNFCKFGLNGVQFNARDSQGCFDISRRALGLLTRLLVIPVSNSAGRDQERRRHTESDPGASAGPALGTAPA